MGRPQIALTFEDGPSDSKMRVLDEVEDGCIVIMHDVYEPTADAVETIVPELVSRGYELLTVSELARGRGGMQPGERYCGF